MDKYAPYVIVSYLIAAGVLGAILAGVMMRLSAAHRRLAREEAAEQAASAAVSEQVSP